MTFSASGVAALPRPSPEFPRRVLSATIDLGDRSALEKVFQEWIDRPIGEVLDLERWLLDISEIFAAISEERSRRYIAMTCATEDTAAEKAYLSFVETVQPLWKSSGFAIEKKLLEHPACAALPLPRYAVLLRDARNQVELFREENLPLETELSRMAQQYQKLCGAMTVEHRGEKRTLPQMAVHLQDPDRETRREAWTLITRRRLQDRDALENLFDRMLEVRGQVAKNAGFANYRDYMFRRLGRFDYTPADCETYHRAVEQIVVPAYRETLARRAEAMGTDRLRPWDLAQDPLGRPPLKP
ncbi:MAG: M3 family metallopeptidase, partial [Kiritimatiellia bacterium]|nr:M3 family metallopeptidase [Kiritimatiellia bacterium]